MKEIKGGRRLFVAISDTECRALAMENSGLSSAEADALTAALTDIGNRGLVEFIRSGSGVWSVLKVTPKGSDFMNSLH